MIDYATPALKYFNNEDIITTVEKTILNGTECDAQIKIFNENGFIELKHFLMNNVQYKNL